MAGHSKWAQIKRKKAANDQKKGKIFSKLLKEIEIAARLGGPNPEGNARLKNAILRAKTEGVPNDNINRAIQRGAGDKDKQQLEEIFYEGFGPGNVAFIAKVITDNRNRTSSEIRHLVSKYGGTLSGFNSVRHLFKERGVVRVNATNINEDDLIAKVLDLNIEDLKLDPDGAEIIVAVKELGTCVERLKSNYDITSAEIKFIPTVTQAIPDEETEKVLEFFEVLDDHDDVQDVYFNAEL
ncbi:MAG: YebC/PmpR family DNA-binding transcriptional regulator [Deltaproteobacteria bacterium]|nr:YebC/PmpR family DNA-binding transcriptional regulator [Deltaproteobacteria bacterium]